jgi:hypothetical protein
MSPWLWASLACNLVLLVGWFLTLGWGETYRVANRHLQARVRTLTDPDPTCGCTHHYSFHDQEGCHYTVTYTHPARFGPRSVLSTCRCVRYVGPEPLPRVIDLPHRPATEEEP